MGEVAKVVPHKRPITVRGKELQVDTAALQATFGSANQDFVVGLVRQLSSISSIGETPNEDGIAFVTSVIGGIEPRDQQEAMLAAQMAAVHNAVMATARQLANAVDVRKREIMERSLNRLTRTYAMQLEALRRYRNGGQQKVIVEHVTVNQGGHPRRSIEPLQASDETRERPCYHLKRCAFRQCCTCSFQRQELLDHRRRHPGRTFAGIQQPTHAARAIDGPPAVAPAIKLNEQIAWKQRRMFGDELTGVPNRPEHHRCKHREALPLEMRLRERIGVRLQRHCIPIARAIGGRCHLWGHVQFLTLTARTSAFWVRTGYASRDCVTVHQIR